MSKNLKLWQEGQFEVPCTVEIERSADSFHAYAVPENVIRAGFFRRYWTQFRSILELTELYHVGFEPKEAA